MFPKAHEEAEDFDADDAAGPVTASMISRRPKKQGQQRERREAFSKLRTEDIMDVHRNSCDFIVVVFCYKAN